MQQMPHDDRPAYAQRIPIYQIEAVTDPLLSGIPVAVPVEFAQVPELSRRYLGKSAWGHEVAFPTNFPGNHRC